jgi:hypothetical protein
MVRLIPLAVLLAISELNGAEVGGCENVNAVKAYAERVDARIKQIKPRLFVQINAAAKWKEVKETPDSAEAMANVYVDKAGLPIAAFFSFAPGSKDWVLLANYYFRADGGLAKKDELLNTSRGRLIVSRNSLFDCEGEVLRTTSQYLDLDTKRKKKPGADFQDESSPVYKRVQDLPFLAEWGRQ